MLQFIVEHKEDASPAMSKLRHDRVVAIECKKPMHVKKIDQQMDKLKALEKLKKKEQVAWEQLRYTRDYGGAEKLTAQLEHAQAEYDAEYNSATTDDTNN